MSQIFFNSHKYYNRLKAAGVPDAQAEAQADALRDALAEFEASQKETLATRGDLREAILQLQKEIRETELRLLKWQWGIALALAAIMAKGFGWIGF